MCCSHAVQLMFLPGTRCPRPGGQATKVDKVPVAGAAVQPAYCHIGYTMIRLLNVTPRRAKGRNSFGAMIRVRSALHVDLLNGALPIVGAAP